jgi:glucose-1-phosphatase
MRTPALIFDFGNVVAHFDYTRAAEALGRRAGFSGPELLARLRSLGLTPLVQGFERGEMTPEAFAASACALAGLDLPHDEFTAAWCDIFWLNEPVARLVATLKARGYTLVLGSNTNALHAGFFRRRFAEHLAPFDRLVLSHEVGHLKPAAPFYHACAEAAGAPPEACVFIDDLPENVAGARAAGLVGLHYRDHPTLLAELRALGVEVPEA